jgi:hypothetical protein
MSQSVFHYKCYCLTEAAYVYTWATSEPTVCPNNNSHSIDTNLTTIIETVSTNTVTAAENSDGYFETSHVVINIPSGTPGTITEHDVVWPMDLILWRTLITPTSDMIGDVLTVVASPETTIGVITANAASGTTTFNVNSTVTSNIWRGFRVNITDGVNKDVLDRCTAKDATAGTITVETPTVNSYNAGSLIQIGVYVLKDINITDTQTIDIGTKGIKGKMITAGMILRVLYTNNSGTAKTIRWRPEIYMMG